MRGLPRLPPLEPCVMGGRVVAVPDQADGFRNARSSFWRLCAAVPMPIQSCLSPVEIVKGVLAAECVELLPELFAARADVHRE